ncbi:RNA methyltransferase [Caenimonas sp. SL110]|uniref:TrmH family RNA methyltransferase n=1 Tax=Caenimonas sp. SL110 TaxID=1450524 RepID=UPI000653D68D|nr:RNA methyltransferase [Caenimonas sp. SL110]
MTTSEPQFVTSPANALVKDLRRLAQDSTAYRKQQRIWLEGDHLCRAALDRGVQPALGVFSESLWSEAALQWQGHGGKTVVMADALFASVSGLESPSRMGFVIDMPSQPAIKTGVATVVLDGLQDPGNVGAILRSAAAFGFRQVVAMKGTAALWSPKVLRAGMGAHFGLHLLEGSALTDVQALDVPVLVTSSHHGEFLHKAQLPWPCAWVLGHEGQGVSAALEAVATTSVRIAQPGGEESLNVASAAAICLHASATARG